jgi:hypothetical protein
VKFLSLVKVVSSGNSCGKTAVINEDENSDGDCSSFSHSNSSPVSGFLIPQVLDKSIEIISW